MSRRDLRLGGVRRGKRAVGHQRDKAVDGAIIFPYAREMRLGDGDGRDGALAEKGREFGHAKRREVGLGGRLHVHWRGLHAF